MRGMGGRFLLKLKSISNVPTGKQGVLYQENAFDQYFQTPTLPSDIKNEEMDKSMLVSDKTKTESLLVEYEEKCPPGGSDSVIFYSTSLRGIRKTFEDCNAIRFLLGSFHVSYDERDVSMHMEFREELWRTLGGKVIPPRLFIKGRLIGGVDEVVGLHEEGKLEELLSGIPKSLASGPCKGCGGLRFVLCCSCNGSRKVVLEEVRKNYTSLTNICVECNENGLVKCPICF